ncbi:MAG: phosphatase PAP2 family protein [Archangiaceae bacterium]|nr:phosphatase PAP2 family protein [Archangiaceae bacterium]
MQLFDTMIAWDESALQRLHALPRRRTVDRVMLLFTRLGDASSWLVLGALMLVLGPQSRRYLRRVTVGVAAATAVSSVLKRVLNRPRPRELGHGVQPLHSDPDAFSFPSGHTAAAIAAATALTGTPLSRGVWPLAISVAASRVYLGAHYPLDVLVGATIGAAAGFAARVVPID